MERELPRTLENEGRDFVQLLSDMVYHERMKDLELIRTLKEGMLFLRTDVINKQATIDSLLKQVDRLTLAVNCSCQQISNNDMTAITGITSFSDLSTNDVIRCSDVSTIGDQDDRSISGGHEDGVHSNDTPRYRGNTPALLEEARLNRVHRKSREIEHPEMTSRVTQNESETSETSDEENTEVERVNSFLGNDAQQMYSRKPDEVFV